MTKHNTEYTFAVVGAGPAGIAAVGKLIDNKVNPKSIAWLDPSFQVGDFGTKWRNVSSNTKVRLFLRFLDACDAFHYSEVKHNFSLQNLDPDQACQIHFMADPLQWVTEQLQQQVYWQKSIAQKLALKNQHWELTLDDSTLYAKNVILAIGSEPKSLSFNHLQSLPLDIALDAEKIKHAVTADDTVAVFGASHSGIIILRHLLENTSAKKVINFYQSPLRFAIHLNNEILFDDTGLKESTAAWARENVHGKHPEKLVRIHTKANDYQTRLSQCNKAVYAIGFQKRSLLIDGMDEIIYNDKNGIIAPGLFGLGIAFPEAKTDRFGNIEHRVGLWKFMDYLNQILPIWLKYSA